MKKFLYIFLLALLSTSASYGQGFLGVTYNMALPLGQTGDYISKYSWRGVGLDGRGFLNERFSLGGTFSWQTFYEEIPQTTFTDGNRSLTGKQWRYINAFPILFTGHYYLGTEGGYRPFLGTGVGVYRIEQRTDMGIWSVIDNNWHFGFAPEAGILIPINWSANVMLSLKYNYALKSNGSINHSWLGISVGIVNI